MDLKVIVMRAGMEFYVEMFFERSVQAENPLGIVRSVIMKEIFFGSVIFWSQTVLKYFEYEISCWRM